jgi:hypothetical protein
LLEVFDSAGESHHFPGIRSVLCQELKWYMDLQKGRPRNLEEKKRSKEDIHAAGRDDSVIVRLVNIVNLIQPGQFLDIDFDEKLC